MKASKLFSPLLVGLLMGWFLCQPAPVFAVVATGTGGGTTLTDSASLRSALSDETGSGLAVFATSPTLTTPILGTPTSGTLTNCTIPVGGVTGLGTGVGTWLATPSSANLASAITNETGTGVAVFGTSPTITDGLTITNSTANTGVLTSTGYSLTGSNATNMVDLAGTWNTSGSPTLIKGNVTNTASGSSAKMLDLQRSGTSVVSVSKAGTFALRNIDSQVVQFNWYASDRSGSMDLNGASIQNRGAFESLIDTGPSYARFLAKSGNAATTYWALHEEGQGVASFRNGTTSAVSLRNYNTYTSSTNNELYRVDWSSNVCYTGVKAGSGGGTKRLQVFDGGAEKTLTESTATAFVQVDVASGAAIAGRINYAIYADDSTDFQTRSGSVHFSGVNKAGTETATLGTVLNESVAASTGTLTVTFDTDTSPTNAFTIRANAVSSLTQTTLKIIYRVELFGPQVTVTPQ